MLKLTTKLYLDDIGKNVKKQKEKAQILLDEQVLKDSNFFVPADTWGTRDSGISASEIGKGRIIWDTPQAKRLYWNPQFNFSKDKNPNARGLWFEEAKSVFVKDWVKAAGRGFK